VTRRPRRRLTPRSHTAAWLSWSCVLLFAARVIGQIEVLLLAPGWLPPMQAWYSGLLPYYLLLPLQIVLLMAMSIVAWNRRVRTGRFAAARPRTAAALRHLACLYFAAMALRLLLNVIDNGADFWLAGAIPVAFHWVLALFLLVSARAPDFSLGRVPAQEQHQDEEADDIPHGDVPSLAQPMAHGFRLREEVGYRNAG
jgi:hypothetical protein